jgi:hypothetical protein
MRKRCARWGVVKVHVPTRSWEEALEGEESIPACVRGTFSPTQQLALPFPTTSNVHFLAFAIDASAVSLVSAVYCEEMVLFGANKTDSEKCSSGHLGSPKLLHVDHYRCPTDMFTESHSISSY